MSRYTMQAPMGSVRIAPTHSWPRH